MNGCTGLTQLPKSMDIKGALSCLTEINLKVPTGHKYGNIG